MTDIIETVDKITPPPLKERVHRVEPGSANHRDKNSKQHRRSQPHTKQDESADRDVQDIVELHSASEEPATCPDDSVDQPRKLEEKDADTDASDDRQQHLDLTA